MKLTIEQALQQGVTAHKGGKLQEAERLYRSIIQSQPLHPDANHNLGILLLSLNKADAALPLLKTALKANSKIEQFWLSYIDALIKEQQFDNAKQVIEQAKKQGVDGEKLNIKKVPLASMHQAVKADSENPPQELLNSLLGHYQNGRFSDAEKLAVHITQDFPKHQFAWKVLGAVLRVTDRKSEAVDANQKVIALSPQDAAAHSNLGATLHELGRLDEALASYNQAIALKSDYADAHYNLGVTLQELGRLEEAEASYDQAIALKPDHAIAHSNLGNTLIELGRLDEAEASLNEAIALKPDFAPAHYNMGNTLKELGRLNEAEASYAQAIALKPDYNEAHSNLGITLQELGRLDEAEASLNQAIALKPDFALAHYNLGNTLKELGRLDEALASYNQAIALKPDFPEAHKNSGFTLFEKGDNVGALNCFQQSLDLKRGRKAFDNHYQETPVELSKSKIDHDIEQFEYLASRSIEKDYFSKLVTEYRTVKNETSWASESGLTKVNPAFLTTLANSRKLLYQAEAGRVNQAISSSLDTNSIYERYFSHESGLTYIDEFLGSEALESLRTFLLESTIWFKEKKGGYLGAYLGEGLASPLILQIASELKSRFPLIIKDHPLNHVWAYKYDSRASDPVSDVTGINIHADFAAVNINFWITQSEANLDPNSGGMVIYNTEAPKDWRFDMYNNALSRIQEELSKSNGRREVIPYRENRMVIFNSNLFHETDKYYFKEGYENRRINVTMLFGRREGNY